MLLFVGTVGERSFALCVRPLVHNTVSFFWTVLVGFGAWFPLLDRSAFSLWKVKSFTRWFNKSGYRRIITCRWWLFCDFRRKVFAYSHCVDSWPRVSISFLWDRLLIFMVLDCPSVRLCSEVCTGRFMLRLRLVDVILTWTQPIFRWLKFTLFANRNWFQIVCKICLEAVVTWSRNQIPSGNFPTWVKRKVNSHWTCSDEFVYRVILPWGWIVFCKIFWTTLTYRHLFHVVCKLQLRVVKSWTWYKVWPRLLSARNIPKINSLWIFLDKCVYRVILSWGWIVWCKTIRTTLTYRHLLHVVCKLRLRVIESWAWQKVWPRLLSAW